MLGILVGLAAGFITSCLPMGSANTAAACAGLIAFSNPAAAPTAIITAYFFCLGLNTYKETVDPYSTGDPGFTAGANPNTDPEKLKYVYALSKLIALGAFPLLVNSLLNATAAAGDNRVVGVFVLIAVACSTLVGQFGYSKVNKDEAIAALVVGIAVPLVVIKFSSWFHAANPIWAIGAAFFNLPALFGVYTQGETHTEPEQVEPITSQLAGLVSGVFGTAMQLTLPGVNAGFITLACPAGATQGLYQQVGSITASVLVELTGLAMLIGNAEFSGKTNLGMELNRGVSLNGGYLVLAGAALCAGVLLCGCCTPFYSPLNPEESNLTWWLAAALTFGVIVLGSGFASLLLVPVGFYWTWYVNSNGLHSFKAFIYSGPILLPI